MLHLKLRAHVDFFISSSGKTEMVDHFTHTCCHVLVVKNHHVWLCHPDQKTKNMPTEAICNKPTVNEIADCRRGREKVGLSSSYKLLMGHKIEESELAQWIN